MSKVSFVKQNKSETISRLRTLHATHGQVTLWIKGDKTKKTFSIKDFHEQRKELMLDTFEQAFPIGSKILCTFEIRGQSFFSEVIFDLQLKKYVILKFVSDLFASEKRSNFRLLTFPLYDITLEVPVETYSPQEVTNVLQFASSSEKTNLFKSFIELVREEDHSDKFKFRVYNLSVSGLLLFVGKMELSLFKKEIVFENTKLFFQDEILLIPKMRVVHVSENPEKFLNDLGHKVGIKFEELPQDIDLKLGHKINLLLRDVDDSEDFENFIK